jgi:hypothetical protein
MDEGFVGGKLVGERLPAFPFYESRNEGLQDRKW